MKMPKPRAGTKPKETWPRIRDLPERERGPFTKWLAGQTRPWIDGAGEDSQDGYFPWDYSRWKAGIAVVD